MKTQDQIKKELKEVATKIENLNYDNNGNPVDFEFANKLFEREEQLFNELN